METTPGKRILIWREFKGLTPAQMIKATGIKRSTLDSVEDPNGSKPSHDTLMKVADAFPDLSARWLLTGKGDMLVEGRSLTPLMPPPAAADKISAPTPGLTSGPATVAEAENILLRAENARLWELVGKSNDNLDAAGPSAPAPTPRPRKPRAAAMVAPGFQGSWMARKQQRKRTAGLS